MLSITNISTLKAGIRGTNTPHVLISPINATQTGPPNQSFTYNDGRQDNHKKEEEVKMKTYKNYSRIQKMIGNTSIEIQSKDKQPGTEDSPGYTQNEQDNHLPNQSYVLRKTSDLLNSDINQQYKIPIANNASNQKPLKNQPSYLVNDYSIQRKKKRQNSKQFKQVNVLNLTDID